MDPFLLGIFEIILFFILLALTFSAIMRLDITKHFQKGAIWQMQIIYIFSAIALSYLVLKAIMNLIEISYRLL